VPTIFKVTTMSETVQTDVVELVYETGNPEDVVPLSEIVDEDIFTLDCVNVIV
jgi:hypothetical protein